jgi:hypothetical protein
MIYRNGARGTEHLAFAVPEVDSPAWRENLSKMNVTIEAKVHGWIFDPNERTFRAMRRCTS